ncbi:hypothetical protein JJJ17_19965 [Paracoccus caeni]|uniref:Uncharacterized protein n=1 Tax=Paracoccus caeni TaxID=657651 RepID=A0A934SFY6_9RHOB|nr:hypothetical protein [Paracoccus caeni]MBK4218211.1 hypothetical protein [Paracoccus caeni]
MIRLSLLICLLAGPVLAAGTPDPDWPCIQRRQPQLSVAQVWAGPQPDEALTELAQDPAIQRLAQVIALRRTPIEDAQKMIADFAESADDQRLTALFLATFDHIQTARNRVMGGITRYAHKQEALDTHIEEQRGAFEAQMALENKDFDAIDRIEQDIDWSTRIFQDRQQALIYVCETPVILEQRAFSIGRAIAAEMAE